MRKLEAQRGKNLMASFPWVDFVVTNTDILTALSESPLKVRRVDHNKYAGHVFGVGLRMEAIQHESTGKKGNVQILADIQLPLGLGRTYTVAKHSYCSVDAKTTSLDLDLSIELTRLMRVYVWFKRDAIDQYLNRVCSDIERVAQALERNDEKCPGLLDEDQRTRVAKFRAGVGSPGPEAGNAKLCGALRVATAPGLMLVSAEARMPDQHILTATERIPLDEEAYACLLAGTRRLAGINNRAFAARGTPSELDGNENVEFHQAALEYGYGFYKRVCSGQLAGIVPIMVSQGDAASIYLSVDGRAEELPWEAMHDGDDFLSLRVRFCRCVAAVQEPSIKAENWSRSGILLVGANPRGDLPGAEAEVERIGNLLTSAGVDRVEVLRGKDATREALVSLLEAGDFNILHFSGHSAFDPQHPQLSFLELAGGRKAFLHELGTIGRGGERNAPLRLAFLNSCQSAMVGQDDVTGKQLSMCKSLRVAGVGYVVGMLWNVEDAAAVQVGSTFYTNLLTTPQCGPEEAMRRTRRKVAIDRAWADGSWLAPVLYV